MAYVNYGWFAPAVTTSGYVAFPKNKELNTILLNYHKEGSRIVTTIVEKLSDIYGKEKCMQ